MRIRIAIKVHLITGNIKFDKHNPAENRENRSSNTITSQDLLNAYAVL